MLKIIENVSRCKFDLSGLYKFCTDSDDVGEKGQWYKGLSDYRELAVPASWNEQYADLENYFGTSWYEKSFFVPVELKKQIVRLRVGAAAYYAKVWVNGHFLGDHEGGHLPFDFDLSKVLRYGADNKVVFSINAEQQPDRLPPGNFPREECHSPWFDQFPANNYDFFPYGGIHRMVTLYSVPKVHIDNIKTDMELSDTGKVKLNFEISTNVSLSEDIQIELMMDNQKVSSAYPKGFFVVENPVLWDMENPYLYDLKVMLKDKSGQILDSYSLPIGLRTVTWDDKSLYLNGKPVFLKGFGKHEDFMIIGKGHNDALMVKDFDLLKWIGANSFRTSHYPYCEDILDYADRHGFLIIDETPFVGLETRHFACDTTLKKAKQGIRDLIDRDYNHPSVIMWSVANEPKSEEPAADAFFKQLADFSRSLDATRPVTMVTCRGTSDVAVKHFDILCLNIYRGWYDLPGQLDKAAQAVSADLDKMYELHKKPIIMTEFGADAIAGMHYEPARQWTEEYQAEMLKTQYLIFKNKDFVTGAHVWAFSDFKTSQIYMRVMLNFKGVFTRERQPKLAARVLKQLWNSKNEQ